MKKVKTENKENDKQTNRLRKSVVRKTTPITEEIQVQRQQ